MDLVNRTPLPASVYVTEVDGSPTRIGALTAKATFRFNDAGRVDLETQDPFPLFGEDQETELGPLPSDEFLRRDAVFEVILLGYAYANRAGGIAARNVRLSVGATTRAIAVFGERVWLENRTISAPGLFDRMPLTYDRAHGGACDLLLDENSPLEIADPINPRGRGFDAEKTAKEMTHAFRFLPGMPVLRYQRRLPNLENPERLIKAWEDAPLPVCWAAIPAESPLCVSSEIQRFTEDPLSAAQTDVSIEDVYHRAHPDWVLPPQLPESPVRLEGVTASETVRFTLPRLRVVADYIVGTRRGSLDLVPKRLVLLPEQGRFYLVLRTTFGVPYEVGSERSFRLRTADGWCTPSMWRAPITILGHSQ